MDDVALPAGFRIATVEVGGRRAAVVLHGSGGQVFTGTERGAVQVAAGPWPEARVVLRAVDGGTAESDRYVIRNIRQQVGAGAAFEFDVDAARFDGLLVRAHRSVVGIVGESSWIPAAGDAPGMPVPIWGASAFGIAEATSRPLVTAGRYWH